MEFDIDVHIKKFILGKSEIIRVNGHGHEIPLDRKDDRCGSVGPTVSAVSKV